MFFDRTEVINLISKRVTAFQEGYRQNLIIFGEEFSGKSTLLKHFFNSNIDRNLILPIYIEIRVEPFKMLIERFIRTALCQLLNLSLLYPRIEDTAFLIENTKTKYPKVAKICIEIFQSCEKGRFDESFNLIFDLPLNLYEASGRRCIVVLDEFQNLINFNLKNPFGNLAKKIMVQTNTMFIIVSSRKTFSEKILQEKLTLLFGNFERIWIGQFEPYISKEFFKSLASPLELESKNLDFIANFVGNRPLYLQIIADYAKSLYLADPHRGISDPFEFLAEVFSAVLFRERGALNQHFITILLKIANGKQPSILISVLQAISSGHKKQNEIARALGVQIKTISKPILKLLELDILEKNGPFYRFKDRLFSFWLNNVYLERLSSLELDNTNIERCFKEKIKKTLKGFICESEKTINSRIMELFGLFKNGVIQLNGKKHRLFQFDEVNLEQDKDYLHINAKARQRKWRCLVKDSRVTENDIVEFIKAKKARRDKKNIIIALDGMEENAYLLAKEANIWTWDLASLNILLDLYGKPQIIK